MQCRVINLLGISVWKTGIWLRKEFLFKDVKHVRDWLSRVVFERLNLCSPETQQMHTTEEAENRAFQPPNHTETTVLKQDMNKGSFPNEQFQFVYVLHV